MDVLCTSPKMRFTVRKGNRRVRIGPLSYVTVDIGYEHFKHQRWRTNPMEHDFLDGTYLTHKLKGKLDSHTYIVITLEQVDPVKVVDSLRAVRSVTKQAVKSDMVFDKVRWTQFAREGMSYVPCSTSAHKRCYRDSLQTKLILGATIGRMLSVRNQQKRHQQQQYQQPINEAGNDIIGTSDDMIEATKRTVFIRQLSTKLGETVEETARFHEKPDELPGIVVTTGKKDLVTIFGIYMTEDVCGCVLYTDSDSNGKVLCRPRAFALVLGEDLTADSTGPMPSDKTSRIQNDPGLLFGPPVKCQNFLYKKDRLEEGGDIVYCEKKCPVKKTMTDHRQQNILQQDTCTSINANSKTTTADQLQLPDWLVNVSPSELDRSLQSWETEELPELLPQDLTDFLMETDEFDSREDDNLTPDARVKELLEWLYLPDTRKQPD